MKKQLLSIFGLLSIGAATAQVTITQADVAPTGSIIYRGIDTTFTETPIGPGGTNMTWDFSGIIDDRGDTLGIVNSNTLPNYSDFPTSNIGIMTGGGTAYATLNSTGMTIVGQTADLAGTPVIINVNPAEIVANFPANYNDAYSNTSHAYGAFPFTTTGVDSVRINSLKIKQVTIDAWGSLTIPFGTFNVIRVKEEIDQIDSIDIHSPGFPPFVAPSWSNFQATEDFSAHYSYWANGVGYPVMEVDSSYATGEVTVTWLLQTPTGIKEQTASAGTMVFPNPAKDMITVLLAENANATIQITDVLGKEVMSIDNQKVASVINVADLTTGIYVYKVTYANGKAESGRFVISK